MKTNQITESAAREAGLHHCPSIWSDGKTQIWDDSILVAEVEAHSDHLAPMFCAAPELLEACRAGGRYSDALNRLQDEGRSGQMVEGDYLDALFMEWHDKTHAAIAKATRA